ncbi:MAG: aspartate 1-decarboxylase [Prevotellaceae bacterium]|jgi:aspartate 1-decarboxylase|nr:aspartate 1-decarboxylase [Prevotellaceae bacterium]
MFINILKSKIHRVTVTGANLDYIGSITIDENLMDAASLIEYERVQVVDVTNGARIETYVIRGGRGTGVICLNGAAAHLFNVGDIVIIMAYAWLENNEAKAFKPTVIFPETATNKLI